MSWVKRRSIHELSRSEKNVIKDMKRDLMKIVSLVKRRTRSQSRSYASPKQTVESSDYGSPQEHMNPTISSAQKRWDVTLRTLALAKMKMSAWKSAERSSNQKKLSREIKIGNPKKLVYPSVRKLKNLVTESLSTGEDQSLQFKRILVDHIHKNMKHMNLKVYKEIERPSVSKMSTHVYPMRLPEIKKLDSEFKKIQKKHHRAGIMRRNKLLLEHIMHERVKTTQVYWPGAQNFRTSVSVNQVA